MNFVLVALGLHLWAKEIPLGDSVLKGYKHELRNVNT